MATSSDSTTISRDSLKQGILGLYNSNAKAGGAFDAYQAGNNTMIIGCTAPFGFTQQSRTLTIDPGFTTGMAYAPKENFKNSVLADDKSTKFKAGFNSQKYTNGSFRR